MTTPEITCLIATGGQGHEAPVSLVSSLFVYNNLPDWARAVFLLFDDSLHFALSTDPGCIVKSGNLGKLNPNLQFTPLGELPRRLAELGLPGKTVVFPAMHGHGGEDGALSRAFHYFGIPVLGCDAASSYICFDKVLTKLCLQSLGLPVVPMLWASRETLPSARPFAGPMFVKPAREGSSCGVYRIAAEEDFIPAAQSALEFDSKILFEPEVTGRELEVAAIYCDKSWAVSPVGEIIKSQTWYDFDQKYGSGSSCRPVLAEDLSTQQIDTIRSLAVQALSGLQCNGFARVDFFLSSQGQLAINEINTIPGMTAISMFPVLMEYAGFPPKRLIETIIREGCDLNG